MLLPSPLPLPWFVRIHGCSSRSTPTTFAVRVTAAPSPSAATIASQLEGYAALARIRSLSPGFGALLVAELIFIVAGLHLRCQASLSLPPLLALLQLDPASPVVATVSPDWIQHRGLLLYNGIDCSDTVSGSSVAAASPSRIHRQQLLCFLLLD